MCFHIVMVNKKRNDLAEIFDYVFTKMKSNGDGFSFVAHGDKNIVCRTLSPDVFKDKLLNHKRAKFVHIHLRAASAGVVNEDNIHCWRIGRYYVSHNGTIPIARGERKGRSDTLAFLENKKTQQLLSSRVNLKSLADHINSIPISWGRIFLTSTDWREFVCAAMSTTYIQKIGDVLTFSNDKLDISRSLFGLKFSVPTAEIFSKVIRFSIEQMKVVEEYVIPPVYSYSYPYYYPGIRIESRDDKTEDDDYIEISPGVWTRGKSEREPETSIKTWHWWGGDKYD